MAAAPRLVTARGTGPGVQVDSPIAPHLRALIKALSWACGTSPFLEHGAGDIVAIEVKAAETVRSEDFRGINHLARRYGDRLTAGIVLCAGTQPLPFGERLRAWPISTLWTL